MEQGRSSGEAVSWCTRKSEEEGAAARMAEERVSDELQFGTLVGLWTQ